MTDGEMQAAMTALNEHDCSCVIRKEGRNHLFRQRGVADLYAVLHERPDLLQGAVVADKVVGKGAAALMIAGGITALHTRIISRPALDLFQTDSTVKVAYDECVQNIVNRSHTGFCPVETLCKEAVTATDCLPLIDEFMKTTRP